MTLEGNEFLLNVCLSFFLGQCENRLLQRNAELRN